MQTVFSGAAGDKHCIEFGFQFIGNSEDDDYGPDASDDLSASAGSYISFICAPEQPVISSCKGRSVTPVKEKQSSADSNSCREKRSLLHLSISFPGSPHTLKFHWWLVEIFLLIEVNMKNGLRIHQGTWVHCPCRY
ncbi:hypothetical protein AAC387_Pa03g4274 [Persea americana]